jgi:hypothetical protein
MDALNDVTGLVPVVGLILGKCQPVCGRWVAGLELAPRSVGLELHRRVTRFQSESTIH